MAQQMTCVLRQVRGLDQYIPIADAVGVKVGETSFTGTFLTDTVLDGPSNSHRRTICLPRGDLTKKVLKNSDLK